jgi:hypothetical protein
MRMIATITLAVLVMGAAAPKDFDVGYDFTNTAVDPNNTSNVHDGWYDQGVYGSDLGYDNYSFGNAPQYDNSYTDSAITTCEPKMK